MWQSLKDTVSRVAGTVRDYLGFSEPKKGPLSNFHTFAPDMMELFAQGIRDNEQLVRNQVARSLAFDVGTIDYALGGVYSYGGAGLTTEGIASANEDVITTLYAVANMLTQEIRNIDTSLTLDGAAVAQKLYPYNQAEQTRVGPSLIRMQGGDL